MDDGATSPAGWFPDPDGSRAWRWWNGEAWDDRTAPYPSPARPGAAPRRWLVWLAALAPGIGVLAAAVVQRAYEQARLPLERAASTGTLDWNEALVTVAIAAAVGLVGELAVVAWLLRSGQLARRLGYRLAVGPSLGALTWLVPIVKLVVPYRLLADLSPLGHPRRAQVRASWVGLVAYQLSAIWLGLSEAAPSLGATLVVAALGLAWWATFAPLVLATARGLEGAVGLGRRPGAAAARPARANP